MVCVFFYVIAANGQKQQLPTRNNYLSPLAITVRILEALSELFAYGITICANCTANAINAICLVSSLFFKRLSTNGTFWLIYALF